MKILDRYLLRESLPPFLLALGLFTFLLGVNPMLGQAQMLLSKGVDVPTTGFLLLTLLPQALGVSIPMAFLAGTLMALGRLSGDREAVALLACGVSPLRLLRPILLLAALAGTADLYCMTTLVPNSNQRFREETFKLLARRSEGDIKPGIFYQGFPGKVLFIRDVKPGGGGWTGVMLADTSKPGRPVVTVAESGYLELNPEQHQVAIVLPGPSIRYSPGEETGIYDVTRDQDVRFNVPASTIFGEGTLGRGLPEMSIAQLRAAEAERVKEHLSPHNEIMYRHQMFSFPVACLAFAVIGLALGLHTRKEGKLGGFTLGLGVICVYYAIYALAQSQTKGGTLPAEWARWVPNLVVGALGAVALWWRSRARGGEVAIGVPAWISTLRRTRPAASGSPPAPTPRLVVRIPQINLPNFRILDRYVAKRYLGVLALSFFGLLFLYYIGTFIDKSEKLFKGQADAAMFFDYFYYSTPQFVVHVVPMSILVAVLATIGGLTRTGELVVMRACGVSIYRAAVPLFVLALIWSGGLFLLDDRVLAHANRRSQALDDRIRSGTSQPASPVATTNWLADGKGRVYYYTRFDTARLTLHNLSLFESATGPFRLVRHIEASRVTFSQGAWRAEEGWLQTFTSSDEPKRQSFTARRLEMDPPEKFSGTHNGDAELMTYGQLRRHVDQQADSGFNMADARVDLQARIAFPLVTLVMTLLAVPFGVTTGRRGAMYGIGLALILAAAYWLLNTFFTAVGHAALLPPALAAWAANLLFLALAAFATLTVRT